MIKDAGEAGGIINYIALDPKEAYEFLMELIGLGNKYITDLTIHDIDKVDVTREQLLWGDTDKHERIKEIIQLWHKTKYEVKFKGIKLIVVKPKKEEKNMEGWVEPDPTVKAPPNVLITEGGEPPLRQNIKSKPWVPELENTKKPRGQLKTPPGYIPKEGDKPDVAPPPPKPPLGRMLNEDGIVGTCEKCGSSLKSKWVFFKAGGCIQPECENYWERYRD